MTEEERKKALVIVCPECKREYYFVHRKVTARLTRHYLVRKRREKRSTRS